MPVFFIKDSEYEVFIMSDLDNGRRKMQVPEIGWTVGLHLELPWDFINIFKKPILTCYVIPYFFQVLISFRDLHNFIKCLQLLSTDAAWTYTLITVSKCAKRQALKRTFTHMFCNWIHCVKKAPFTLGDFLPFSLRLIFGAIVLFKTILTEDLISF